MTATFDNPVWRALTGPHAGWAVVADSPEIERFGQ
jgi:hypothetical protein